MTANRQPITGDLVAFDEEFRTAVILSAVSGAVAVIGDAYGLVTALNGMTDIELATPAERPFGGVLIARSPRDSSLAGADADQLLTHASAGRPWIVDTTVGDGIRTRLSAAGHEPLVIAEVEVSGTLLAPEDGELPARAMLISEVPVATSGTARRELLFGGGLEPAPIDVPGRLRLFPTNADEVAYLRRAVRDLELANRRLAEGRLGVHDAAAARAASAARELAAARAEVVELHERLESAVFHAKQNDELFQDARLQLLNVSAEAARLRAELYRHQVEPKKLAKRAIARVRNHFRPR